MQDEVQIVSLLVSVLSEKKAVLVPGLGTFRISFSHARNLHGGQLLCPPQNVISFDPVAKLPDLEFAKEVAARTGKTYSEAHGLIDAWVREILDGLKEKKQQHDVEGLGSFYKDGRGVLCFAQQDGLNLHPASYGLYPLVTDVKNTREKIIIADDESILPGRRKSLRALWILIPLFLLGAAVAAYFFLPDVRKKVDDLIGLKSPEPVEMPVKVKKDTAVQIRRDSLKKDTSLSGAGENGNRYYIVAGSFEQEENAVKLQNELKEKGYAPEIVRNGKWFVVSYNSFFNRDFANRSLEKIRNAENPKAYLLVK